MLIVDIKSKGTEMFQEVWLAYYPNIGISSTRYLLIQFKCIQTRNMVVHHIKFLYAMFVKVVTVGNLSPIW